VAIKADGKERKMREIVWQDIAVEFPSGFDSEGRIRFCRSDASKKSKRHSAGRSGLFLIRNLILAIAIFFGWATAGWAAPPAPLTTLRGSQARAAGGL
jgi:hypothetical protein